VTEHDRLRWSRALLFAGWMSVAAYVGYLITQIRRAAAVHSGSFEDGIWGQRVELVSFASLPQNVVILAPGVAAAIAAALLVRSVVDPVVVQLQVLLRIIAGLSLVIISLGVVGIIGVFLRNFDNVGDIGAILGRAGGILLGIGAVRLCIEAENTG
jgi:hypothetical protein